MRKMKKMLAVIMGVSMVAGMTSAVHAESADGDKTVITYWNGFTGTDGEVMQKIIDTYRSADGKSFMGYIISAAGNVSSYR